MNIHIIHGLIDNYRQPSASPLGDVGFRGSDDLHIFAALPHCDRTSFAPTTLSRRSRAVQGT